MGKQGSGLRGWMGPAAVVIAAMGFGAAAASEQDVADRVSHHFADSGGVKIHYVSIGQGPLVLFIHGFPDYWYSWRHQMEALAERHRCVAMDLRGYNQSDKPKGQEQYDASLLVADVIAVIRDTGQERATVVGHDWGGFVAWQVALSRPEAVERLIICNLPHPRGIMRELATNEEQQRNSQYARNFQLPEAHKNLTAEGLAMMRSRGNPDLRARFQAAFEQSDMEAMLNYYKQNYPREPYQEDAGPLVKVAMPVLMFHGLKDTALHHHGLNNTWEWLDQDLTLVTIPSAGHWVHEEAPDLVSRTMRAWLEIHAPAAP